MTNSMPEVSVVMITYGHEKFIEKAIKGVFAQQTGFPVELIIADDHSPDRTAEVVRNAVAGAPDHVKVLYTRHVKNKGMMPNFRWAVAQATGKYIALCEGDDYWIDPLKLQKQVRILEDRSDVHFVYTDSDRYHTATGKWDRALFAKGIMPRATTFEAHLEQRGYLAPHTWLFRRSTLVENLPSEGSSDGTFELALDMLALGVVYYLDEVTAVKNELPGSASNPVGYAGVFAYQRGVLESQARYAEKYGTAEALKYRILSGGYLRLLPGALRLSENNFIEEARDFFTARGINFDELLEISRRAARLEQLSLNPVYRFLKRVLPVFSGT